MDYLRRARLRKGYTQEHLAKLCGVDRRRIGDFEAGRRCPEGEVRELLALHLNLEMSRLNPVQKLPFEVMRKFWSPPSLCPDQSSEPWDRAAEVYRQQIQTLATEFPREFREKIPCDSALECLAWLQLAHAGAKGYLASPLELGFQRHPLMRGPREALGLERRPCLYHVQDDFQYLIWPQICLRANQYLYRIDGLISVRKPRGVTWCDLEIDGQGHDSHRNEKRRLDLDLPELRFSSADITGMRFVTALHRLLSELACSGNPIAA